MKVRDLIKQLSVYNQDMEVKACDIRDKEFFSTIDIKKVGVKYDDCVFLEVVE